MNEEVKLQMEQKGRVGVGLKPSVVELDPVQEFLPSETNKQTKEIIDNNEVV